MQTIKLNTTQRVVPMLYAYSTPEIKRHDGWLKIGYTEKKTVEERIREQTNTSDTKTQLEWKSTAIYDDGSGDTFTDLDFHSYLQKNNVERMPNKEWFKISPLDSKTKLYEFKQNKGVMFAKGTAMPYTLRDEQNDAVIKTLDYFNTHENGQFLWNAKPRFGKTLATYDLCKRLKSQMGDSAFNVLIVTNRPAIANSWYEDFVKFLGNESDFVFVSETDSLKGKPFVLTREQFINSLDDNFKSPIEFLSLQDLKGSIHFGGTINKLSEIKSMNWDLLVVDEAHEGVDTFKTDVAFNQIKKKHTLHLSGTPFKALADEKFPQNAIYNWTYADEQSAKANWNYENGNNPYENLPKLNLFTYQMSQMITDKLQQGIEIDGEREDYAFDLNLFFETDSDKKFKHEESVDKFLDSLTKLEKYPFSTPELRAELKHTLWLLDRVESAKAMYTKLKNHPIFGDYEIILAAGDGKIDDEKSNKKSFDKVIEAIKTHDKTITLSVGQLTTGITISQWSAVLMLSNIQSPSLYMQAAFRSQNPWKFQNNGKYFVKENAYIFDFDPARTLTIFEEFANDLTSSTNSGKGDSHTRLNNVRELLNFFPVVGEDENGEMIQLDAEKVLSIPRKIRSVEVVKRGFMSNFLFQNISNIFNAPQEVIDIIKNFAPISQNESLPTPEQREKVTVNEQGEVEIDKKFVENQTKNLFGDKIYAEIPQFFASQTNDVIEQTPEKKLVEKLHTQLKNDVIKPIMEITSQNYSKDLRAKDEKAIQKNLEQKTERIINNQVSKYAIEKNELESKLQQELLNVEISGKTHEEISQKYNNLIHDTTEKFIQQVEKTFKEAVPELTKEVVETVEKIKINNKKETIEDAVRDHLRGFSRTIPSFLMAYGDENTTLENFDAIIPDDVFKEVTSITLDEFRFLRDGGKYVDSQTGEEKFYQGKLFDKVVFDDSVKEFLTRKKQLANYFDESNTEDIFDYIPPQKTNQIFTPKKVVKQMVDMLEQENPNCFDDPKKTFADLYMKSGLYIAEIVKRLYNSPKLIEIFPNSNDRLNHIFENQVFGLAPTEIIYRISLNFILGFDENYEQRKHNFRQVDALLLAKEGTLNEKLDELFNKAKY